MKILILGSAGFIGSNLYPILLKNHQVWSYDKKDGLDIFDDQLEDIIKQVDVVIHLAALTSVSASFDKPADTHVVNVLGTAKITYLCAKFKKKLIYPSSAAIYHKELSPYAYSKYLAEEMIKGVMGKTDVVILRLFNVFGENMNKNSGSIMYNFLNDNPITIYGDGEQTRDFIHVRDVVSIMEDTLNSKWNNKIVELGTGQTYTANYVAGLFSHYRKVKMKYLPPKREIKWSVANTQMLKSLYKKPLTTNLEKDIKELCKK